MTTDLRCSAEWDRPAIAGPDGTTYVQIRLIAPAAGSATRRSPVDLAFVLDRSGSMDGRPIALARQAVSHAVGLLDHDDRATLVVFDDEVEVVHRLTTMNARNRNELRVSLARVDARGSTDLCSGWLTGCRELARYPAPTDAPRVRRAIVLTDGLANHGVVEPSAIAGHAAELRTRGISTTALGMGPGFDQHLLSTMAEAGGGNFVYIESEAWLGRTFDQELGRLTTVTATGVSVRLRVPDGVHGELLSPFPVERQQRRFDVAVDDLSDGDEVTLIFAIENCRRPIGDRLPFELSVRWTDPRRDARQTDRIEIDSIDVVDERAFLRMTRVRTVAAEVAIVLAAAAQREAMLLDQSGDFAGSRRRHQEAADLLSAAPLAADDAHLAESARSYATYDAGQAFSEHDRKQAVYLAVQRTRRARRSMDDSAERD